MTSTLGAPFGAVDVESLWRIDVAGVGFGDDRAFRLRDGQDRAVEGLGGKWTKSEQAETCSQERSSGE
jgi:hypothetical protein